MSTRAASIRLGLLPLAPSRRAWLLGVTSLLLLTLSLTALHRELGSISLGHVRAALALIDVRQLLLALFVTASSFLVLTGYDLSALAYIGKRLPFSTVLQASACGYALANTIGLSLVSGGSVRYRIYLGAGLDGADVARITVFCAIAFGAGATAVSAIAMLFHPDTLGSALSLDPDLLRACGVAMAVGLTAAVLGTLRWTEIMVGGWRVRLPSAPLLVRQLVISSLDILLAALCLALLLPPVDMPFLAFVALFACALAGGLISHVPGGVGVFESVMMIGLRGRAPPEGLIAGLLVYRLVYYIVPFLLASLWLVAREIFPRARLWLRPLAGVPRASARLTPLALSMIVFGNGMLLLWSTVTPMSQERLRALQDIVPLAVVEGSHLAAALTGLALLVIARGLYRRLAGAPWLTIGFCLLGATLSLGRGLDYEQALLLLTTSGIAYASRREFYRKSRLMTAPPGAAWTLSSLGALAVMTAALLFAYKHTPYVHALWWRFEYDAQASRALRALLAAAGGLALVLLQALLRPPRTALRRPGLVDLERAARIVRRQDSSEAVLALMGDKEIMFAENDAAMLMYGVRGQTWIALGDPIGESTAVETLAWRFRERADAAGARIAFYQVAATNLPLYIDMGLTPFKLGEFASVSLPRFTLEGGARKALRAALSRGERDGLEMTLLDPHSVPSVMAELAAVSTDWLRLKATREKRFSLGYFDPAFLARLPVAVVRCHGRIVAFATLLTTDTRAEVAVDLMRHAAEAPPVTMMYLFVRLLLHFRAQGYTRFALGMAPLAGLESHPLAPLWERFGSALYTRGGRFYGFRGLHEFKSKFDPEWEPRYLVTQGALSPVVAIVDLAALISGGVAGVVRR